MATSPTGGKGDLEGDLSCFSEDGVQMLEYTGAAIAADYHQIMGKLRGVGVSPHEKPQNLPEYDDWEAIEQLMRIIEQDTRSEPTDR